ncbi:Fic family protein [Candidatus Sumerlaeota bacterium]|nr:Fic family protein [Candidatus Sumerlaeota bacterium]
MLGECQSKCEHLAWVPLRPSVASELNRTALIKGSAATTAIEGNTLTEEEIRRHLDGQLRLPPSREYLTCEVDNVVGEFNRIVGEVIAGRSLPLDPETIMRLNGAVLEGLDLHEGVIPGEIRSYQVGVGLYRGAPPEDCESLLRRLCEWLEEIETPEGMRIVFAILRAVLSHLYLAWIHPFGDGNGRTARLIEFQILVDSGVPAPAAHLLSSHYNRTRAEYYRQLEQASISGGDVIPFLMYAVQGFLDGLREQLEWIRAQMWDVVWRNFVHEMFRDKTSASQTRKRHLALDLSLATEPIPISQVPKLSPRLAMAYARKTAKTLTRDINALIEMGLVRRTPEGVRARREVILAFLPASASP